MIKYDTRLSEDRIPMLVRESTIADIPILHNSSDAVVEWCRHSLEMHRFTKEHVICIAYDTKLNVIGYFTVSIGTVSASIMSIREVMIPLLAMGASRFILVHNHPSGDSTPSKEDVRAMEKAINAGKLLDMELADFIIIGNGNYYSAQREGRV